MPKFICGPREGGYTFVKATDWPGFSFMLRPGEDDKEMMEAFRVFRRYERRASWLRVWKAITDFWR